MFIVSSLKVAVFVAIVSRLFYLQISENIKWRSLSDKNRLREWKIAPQRGIIEDYFGTKIAKNTQVFQLHMIPEDVPDMEELFFSKHSLYLGLFLGFETTPSIGLWFYIFIRDNK